ncbi:hypothetical protein [Vibrio crassostreae]|uniref:hypothetical protein n=1 Tax=Vibrio crassostreae TaxID=246167 RepID=UPI000F4A13BC|nr:hypothetical protein [Vibrio crassostreae]ROS65580.1 hypothetical protein EDB73_10735 [Vibrio crassostreae]RPF12601.1 hypothetical protein EDB12_4310 [Vibrio crassostreae]TCT39784.1 hypothetical protein EDB29_106174 [Vibrio crassostreae]TCV60208.1 hypothetical protein EDB74_109186 [Vibrio crassostreae]
MLSKASVFAFVLLMHFFTLFTSGGLGFKNDISFEVIAYSTIDVLFSCLLVVIVLAKFPSIFSNSEEVFKAKYAKFFDDHYIFIAILVIATAYQAYSSIGLIMSGAARHQLLQEHDRGGVIYMISSGFFKMLVPMVFYFGASKKVKFLSVLGLLFVCAITASRSELKYVINFYIMLMLFSSSKNQLARVGIIVSIMVFFAILSTIFLQNRPIAEGAGAVLDMARSTFQYRAYPYFLADISLETANSFYKYLYPFFGYISEAPLRIFFGTPNPIDSAYVGDLHHLGTSTITGRPYLANVLFPWWSWFVGSFGFLGLIIKVVYSYALLAVTASQKMFFTTVVLLTFILLGSGGAHPLMTLTHVLSIFTCIAIDVIISIHNKYKFKV